jgi:alpha-beta hydrolase superfamily lysophospholipase
VTIRHAEGVFGRRRASDPKLYYYAASPEGAAIAIVGVLHGYAEHAGRYRHVADAWAARGIATVSLDLRGHGRAEGTRGYCERFEEYVSDAAELVGFLQDRATGAPSFLFGHSFGGLVAASLVLAQPSLPLRGIVLGSPYFGLALDVPRAKRIAGKIASRIAPKLALPAGIRGTALTHDPAIARAYDEDPLVFKRATARWFTETAAAQDRAIARAGSLTMPLYVVMGDQDRVAKLSRAREFFQAAGSSDKTWDERPGLLHEVLNEPQWRPIADCLAEWIAAH